MELETIKKVIEDGLKKTGSWDDLSKATGLHVRTLSAWYAGHRSPRVARFMKFVGEVENL